MNDPVPCTPRRASLWAIALAFTLVYVSWGTTYLAIKRGVQDEQLPPWLFSGTRVCLAGILLLGFLAARGQTLHLTRRDLGVLVAGGLLLFVGGNGVLTLAQRTLPSGTAAVLGATTPLWIALVELCWPGGDRLRGRGWFGLLLGLTGVLILMAPRLHNPVTLLSDAGPLLMLSSSLLWALGSVVMRYRRVGCSPFTAAGYQMLIGGGALALIGLVAGEAGRLSPAQLTPGAVWAFCHLLIFGSLVGFVAFNWLLGHVSAAQVGTYAYVNPVIAVLVGWLIDREHLTVWVVGGIGIILAGVALVRSRSATLPAYRIAPTPAREPMEEVRFRPAQPVDPVEQSA
jgi:drug/metabolite transporter (DMT)-like permease